jgi:predicted Zn-ribbon and HTH transcriptional regulator
MGIGVDPTLILMYHTHMSERTVRVKEYTCERCGHTWMPRKQEKPKVCPNPQCKSPYWDRPRRVVT